jgi:hypothetical protein
MAPTTEARAMTVIVLGVDPGDSMGIAELSDGWRTFVFQGPPNQALDALEQRLARARHPSTAAGEITIACERFVPMQGRRMSHQPTAQQLYGVVKRIAESRGIRFIAQGSSEARGIAPTQFMQAANLWTIPSELGLPDANDANMAMRHAILALAKYHATLFDQIHRRAELMRS